MLFLQKMSDGLQYATPLVATEYAPVQGQVITSPVLDVMQQAALMAAVPEASTGDAGPKRLHVTNIPFRFRDHDLRQMFGVRLKLLIFQI